MITFESMQIASRSFLRLLQYCRSFQNLYIWSKPIYSCLLHLKTKTNYIMNVLLNYLERLKWARALTKQNMLIFLAHSIITRKKPPHFLYSVISGSFRGTGFKNQRNKLDSTINGPNLIHQALMTSYLNLAYTI